MAKDQGFGQGPSVWPRTLRSWTKGSRSLEELEDLGPIGRRSMAEVSFKQAAVDPDPSQLALS